MAKKTKQGEARTANPAPDKKTTARQELLRQARIDTINDVSAVLDHEVSNLIGALTTCVQILRRNPHLTGEDAQLLDIIQAGSRRLGEIISAFSALGNRGALRTQPVDLHALIDETFARLQRDERCSSSIVIRRKFDPTVPSVEVDREQLGQAIWNLFLNAVQAMGDRGDLRVETQRVGRRIKSSIQDTGPGIPPAVFPRMFEPLYSTKPRGLGLGLAIARQIVEKHGGQIKVDSKSASGACFTVLLPITRSE